jgi:hypothetical protein
MFAMHRTRPEARLCLGAVGRFVVDRQETEIRRPGFRRFMHAMAMRRSLRLGGEWSRAEQKSEHGKQFSQTRHIEIFQF